MWASKRRAYLALELDLFTRRPVGWALSLLPDSALTKKVLTMAYESRGNPGGVTFNSDQACSTPAWPSGTGFALPDGTKHEPTRDRFMPHAHNDGLPPVMTDGQYWNALKSVAKIT